MELVLHCALYLISQVKEQNICSILFLIQGFGIILHGSDVVFYFNKKDGHTWLWQKIVRCLILYFSKERKKNDLVNLKFKARFSNIQAWKFSADFSVFFFLKCMISLFFPLKCMLFLPQIELFCHYFIPCSGF